MLRMLLLLLPALEMRPRFRGLRLNLLLCLTEYHPWKCAPVSGD